MSIDLTDIRIDAIGAVAPPANMMEAARQSLQPVFFEMLMEFTGGRVPTAAELCAVADYERTVTELVREAIRKAISALLAPLSNDWSAGGVVADTGSNVGETQNELFVPSSN